MDRDSLNKLCEISGELGKAMMVIEARNQEIATLRQTVEDLQQDATIYETANKRLEQQGINQAKRVSHLEQELRLVTEPSEPAPDVSERKPYP